MNQSIVMTRRGAPRGTVRRAVESHRLLTFFLLACALSWALVPFTGFPLGVGPTLAAMVVLGVTEGRVGIVELFRRVVHWRVDWKWYVAALSMPAVAAGAAAVITVALGAPAPTAAQLAEWKGVIPLFLLLIVVPVMGPWEEPGFRGFALSEFRGRFSPLAAGLSVGVMHVVWHLPLFLTGDIPTADVVYILAASIVFAWMVVGSGGSVLLAMIMHGSSNAISGEFVSPMFEGSDASTLGWIRAAIWCLFALAVLIAAGPSFRRSPLHDELSKRE